MPCLKQDNRSPVLNICTCGKVHLSYGSVTFHFEAKEFTFFACAVAQLLAQYQQIYAAGPSYSISSPHIGSCH